MALKLTYQASEFLLDIKNLPSRLLREMEEFKKRNKIIGNKYCNRCLNAHLLKKAKDFGIRSDLIIQLKESITEDIGHEGYYLDRDELVKF